VRDRIAALVVPAGPPLCSPCRRFPALAPPCVRPHAPHFLAMQCILLALQVHESRAALLLQRAPGEAGRAPRFPFPVAGSEIRSQGGGQEPGQGQGQGIRAVQVQVQPPPFPPCAARQAPRGGRGRWWASGPGGGWGAPGAAPGPRPPRPHAPGAKKAGSEALRSSFLKTQVGPEPLHAVGEPAGAACGVSELPVTGSWVMGVAIGGGRLGVVWSPPALAAFARTK
jgi:hypothetical protein